MQPDVSERDDIIKALAKPAPGQGQGLRPLGPLIGQGVLFSKLFDASGEQKPLTEAPLTLPKDGPNWLWAHIDLIDRRCGSWLSQVGISPDLAKYLQGDDVRQMADYEGALIFGTIAEPDEDTQHYKSRHGLLRFIVADRWIITGRFNPLNCVEALNARIERGERISVPLQILEKLMFGFHHQLQDEAGKMLHSIDRIEDMVIDSGGTSFSSEVAGIRRTTAHMLRQIANYRHIQHELAHTLSRLNYPENYAELAQDYLARFEALRSDVQSLQDRARLVKDEIASNLAQQMNQSLYVLSLMSALLLPPSVIFGLFGVNVGGVPWISEPIGFAVVVALGLLSACCVFLIMRRRN